MTPSFNDLYKKTIELEERLDKLNKTVSNSEIDTRFSLFNNNCINATVITQKTITLAKFDNNKSQMYYSVLVNFYVGSKQEIEFYLLTNNSRIGHLLETFEVGNHTVTISGVYEDKISEKIQAKILVNPKEDKAVLIGSSTLTIWGNLTIKNDNEFNAIETNSNYILSYCSNQRLYLKKINKSNIDSQEESNFEFVLPAKSHALCYDKNNDICYLLRIDNNDNLFFSDTIDFNEKFVANNVSKCSAIFNNSLIISFIKSGQCYYSQFENNNLISIKKVNQLSGEFKDCNLFFDNANNKNYLVLTKLDESNYLFESVEKVSSNGESINATISISITTYEEQLWSLNYTTNLS